MLDLVLLVPGNQESATFSTLFTKRRDSLGIREILFEISVNPLRDPGCFLRGPEILSVYRGKATNALIVLDWKGSGQEAKSALDIERELRERLGRLGWAGGEALVIDPELESWVFSDSPHVGAILGWQDMSVTMKAWLESNGHWIQGAAKPRDPQLAMETVLARSRIPRSSSIFQELAEKVSLNRCSDPSFHRFCKLVRGWFPDNSNNGMA